MKLYFFPVAPNPTRVRLFLAEKAEADTSIAIEQVLVNLPEGAHKTPVHLARNPTGRLPVLELDDGSHLTESLAIIEYLEERHPEPPLVGATAEERARVRELERVCEMNVLHPIARLVHNTDSPLGLPPNPPVADYFRAALPEGMGRIDEALSDGRRFLAGEHVTIADFTLAAALQFGRFRKLEFDRSYEHIERWDAAFRERPSAKQVLVL